MSNSDKYELKYFNSYLSELLNGEYMFDNCYKLTSFDGHIPNIETAKSMFSRSGLTEWSTDMTRLVDGESMFYHCDKLTSFDANLGSLSRGYCMFADCSELTYFNSYLGSLGNAAQMFSNCKLNTDSGLGACPIPLAMLLTDSVLSLQLENI